MFNDFLSNKLFTLSQLSFLTGDSCIPQLLSIIYEIQAAFDNSPTVDVRGVFLDISKGFDKLWHDGLIFKLWSYGVEGELLSLLQNFATFATPNLQNREQRAVLNGRTCGWRKVNSGVPVY